MRTGSSAFLAGTGLGLTLARELTRINGGTVELRDRPGGGARYGSSCPPRDRPRNPNGRPGRPLPAVAQDERGSGGGGVPGLAPRWPRSR